MMLTLPFSGTHSVRSSHTEVQMDPSDCGARMQVASWRKTLSLRRASWNFLLLSDGRTSVSCREFPLCMISRGAWPPRMALSQNALLYSAVPIV